MSGRDASRRSLSIRTSCYDDLRSYCSARELPMAPVVEDAIRAYLDMLRAAEARQERERIAAEEGAAAERRQLRLDCWAEEATRDLIADDD